MQLFYWSLCCFMGALGRGCVPTVCFCLWSLKSHRQGRLGGFTGTTSKDAGFLYCQQKKALL